MPARRSSPNQATTSDTEARVPWRLITELRAALTEAGVDWREVHAALTEPE